MRAESEFASGFDCRFDATEGKASLAFVVVVAIVVAVAVDELLDLADFPEGLDNSLMEVETESDAEAEADATEAVVKAVVGSCSMAAADPEMLELALFGNIVTLRIVGESRYRLSIVVVAVTVVAVVVAAVVAVVLGSVIRGCLGSWEALACATRAFLVSSSAKST